MAQQTITLGTPDAGDGESLRSGGVKINANFTDLYGFKSAVDSSSGIIARTGSGTFSARTISAFSSKIIVSNGNGVSGNPTIGLGSVASSDLTDAAYLAPAIPAGRWMVPEGITASSAGTAPGSGSIRMFAARIRKSIIITDIGARIITISGGGNVQLAIYAADATTLMPTGAALYSTGSLSTGSLATVSVGSLSIAVTPGVYWFASNCDNGTAALCTVNSAHNHQLMLYGSTSLATVMGSGAGVAGLAKTQTFGTWPTLTGSFSGDSLSEVVSQTVPLIAFKS